MSEVLSNKECSNCGAILYEDGDNFRCQDCGSVFYLMLEYYNDDYIHHNLVEYKRPISRPTKRDINNRKALAYNRAHTDLADRKKLIVSIYDLPSYKQ